MRKIISFVLLLLTFSSSILAAPLALDSCLSLARQHNRTLQNAQLSEQMALLQKREAFSKYFPTLSVNGGAFKAADDLVQTDIDYSKMTQGISGIAGQIPASMQQTLLPVINSLTSNLPTHIGMVDDGVFATASAMQPVFVGCRIITANKLAKIGLQAAGLQTQLTEQQVEQKVTDYYWQCVSLKHTLSLLDTLDVQLADAERTTRQYVQAGFTTRNDLLRVQVAQQELASKRLSAENGLHSLLMLLAQQCGQSYSGFDVLNQVTQADSPLPYYQEAGSAVKHRMELQLADIQVQADRQKVNLERGKYLPSVMVGATGFYHNLMEKDQLNGMLMAAVSVPVTDWIGGSQALKRKKLEMQQAENQRQDAEEMLVVDIQNKWNQLQEAYSQVLLAQKSVEQARENLRIIRSYYQSGTNTLTDFLDAQSLYQQQETKRISALTTYQSALTAYRLASGQ